MTKILAVLLVSLLWSSGSTALIIPRNATSSDSVDLALFVADAYPQSLVVSSATVEGFTVRVIIRGSNCSVACGVTITSLYRFALGQLPSGNYTIDFLHYSDYGTLIRYDTIHPSERFFVIRSDVPPVAVPGPLGVPLPKWLVFGLSGIVAGLALVWLRLFGPRNGNRRIGY